MSIDSYNKFRDYCLRALGQDEEQLIKVEVTERQIKDRIEDALQKWQDFHFEGNTQVNIYKNLTMLDGQRGYCEVEELNAIAEILTISDAEKSNAEVMDDLDYRFHLEYADNHFFTGGGAMDTTEMGLSDFHISMEYLATMRYLLSADKLFTFNATTGRLYLTGKDYPWYIEGSFISSFDSGNWVAGTGTLITLNTGELPNGAAAATKLENTDTGANPISVAYTKTTNHYPRGLRTFGVWLQQGTYTGRIKLKVTDRNGTVVSEKIVQPLTYWKEFYLESTYKEGHINDFVFTVESVDAASDVYFFANAPYGYRNNFIILSGFAQADPEEVPVIWNSGWLKSYSIALLKRQWAQNLKKYDGVQMAGGVTLNAQTMYDEAQAEIERLNEDLDTKWSLPPAIFIG